MSNTYLTTNADVAAAYEAQAGQDGGMSADEFANWHYQNYGQNEGRDGWGGGGMLAQATESAPAVDYRTQIQADLARAGTDADLNAYLASTQFTPEQFAEVSGYNVADISNRMSQARGGSGQGTQSYLQANPSLATEYYKGGWQDQGYTLEEYAMQDWQKNGAKPGFGFSANEQGYLQSAAPEVKLYQSKLGDDQLQGIAQFFMREMANTNEGPGKVSQAMQQYGVSPDDLAYAVSKYGDQYKAYDSQDVHKAYMIKNLFGGSKDQALLREPTPEERKAMDIRRAVLGAGKYSGSRSNVPGEMLAEAYANGSSTNYTQNELDMATANSSWNYQRADGSYVDLLKDPNWKQTIQDKVDSEKARWAGMVRQSEGKVSPFAVGGSAVGEKNAPGKGVNELAPGLNARGVRSAASSPQGAAQPGQAPNTAAKPGGVQSPAVTAAKAQALQPTTVAATQIPVSAQVNQNDLGINQKYGAEIKSDRASQALYTAYLRDLAQIDKNTSLSPAQRDAAKQQAAAKADRLLSYRKGA